MNEIVQQNEHTALTTILLSGKVDHHIKHID